MSFRDDFVWGAASAAYQCEGAAFEDGKGLSVWDMMCRKENAIWENQVGDVACDHYHRYQHDVALMKQMGLGGYRFSLSWPRILPQGVGSVNEKGLDFYDRLVDELLAAGVTPFVTLFHWDYPYELYRRGGWLNSASPDWFAEYTRVVAERLSDRVTNWMTLNEPQCFIGSGHMSGLQAPGDQLGWTQGLLAAHHTLLAHGRAVQTLRQYAQAKPNIGIAPVGVVKIPNTETAADIDAARQAMFAVNEKKFWNNTWWLDPIFFGQYPEDGLELFGKDMPPIGPDDMNIINQPLDFCGANIYNGRETRAGADGQPEEAPRPLGFKQNAMGWAVVPESLYWGPKFFAERYNTPIVITENGLANIDWVALDGKVHDPQRIDFMHRYLRQLHRAATDGVDIRGYFHWCFCDNFEWTCGFSPRLGLVHVDFKTQKRTLKDSAYWYQNTIAQKGRNLYQQPRKIKSQLIPV